MIALATSLALWGGIFWLFGFEGLIIAAVIWVALLAAALKGVL